MKKSYLFAILLFLFCRFIGFSQNFTWVKGSSISGLAGNYGSMAVPSVTNNPGGRHGCAKWTDASGNLWLFGGEGYSSTNTLCWLNDLWKYDISTNTWIWMRGSNGPNQISVYGTQGVASPLNEPGAREFANSWTDLAGNFWMFGGDGFASNSTFGRLGDLWKYNPSTNQWTWMKGFNTVVQNGIYGTQGVSSPSNMPGCRYYSATWTDATGDLWMFGGRGYPATGIFQAYLNDMWKYNVITNEWTWMQGSNQISQNGLYGTLSVPSATNYPGSRGYSSCWTDASNNVYIFGGLGLASVGAQSFLNDLWRFNPTTNTWTWLSGSNVTNVNGLYGTLGVASPTNVPGSRYSSASWKDAQGNFWLFGGAGFTSITSTVTLGDLNDLWKYNPGSNSWTWMKGSSSAYISGTYGSLGVTVASNMPGSRQYNNWWKGNNGKFWLFGGEGMDASTPQPADHMSDLWYYDPPCSPDSITSLPGKIICSGNSVTLTALSQLPSTVVWYNSSVSNSSLSLGSILQTNTLLAMSSPSVYSYFAEANSCTVNPRASISITVNPLPTITVLGTNSICSGVTTSLSASGANTYTWNTGANTATISVLATASIYTCSVSGTDGNGCVNTAIKSISVIAQPTITIANPTSTICNGSSIVLTANGAATYTWNTGASTSTISALASAPIFTCNVTGTASNSCTGSASVALTVFTNPTLSINTTHSLICKGQSTTLTATGANTYFWAAGQNSASIVVTPSANTSYTVTGTAVNGCSSSAAVTQTVLLCLGMDDVLANSDNFFSIYPNPNNGEFSLVVGDLTTANRLVLVNMLGEVLIDQNLNQYVSSFKLTISKGIYQLVLFNLNQKISSSKLIVQ